MPTKDYNNCFTIQDRDEIGRKLWKSCYQIPYIKSYRSRILTMVAFHLWEQVFKNSLYNDNNFCFTSILKLDVLSISFSVWVRNSFQGRSNSYTNNKIIEQEHLCCLWKSRIDLLEFFPKIIFDVLAKFVMTAKVRFCEN